MHSYLCSAVWEMTGGDRRYLLREVETDKTGQELTDEVKKLFADDIMRSVRAYRKPGEEGEGASYMERPWFKNTLIQGSVTDLSIEPMGTPIDAYKSGIKKPR